MTTATIEHRERLETAWAWSDRIFDLLDPAAWYERPIALRQPFIFYLGHLPAFGWNQVIGGLLARGHCDAEYDTLFARGIDPVGTDRYEPDRPERWPTPEQVLAYRDRVRAALRTAFDDVAALDGRDELADRGRVWRIVIEHELMHHETLLYMVHRLRRDLVRRPADLPAYRFGSGAPSSTVAVEAGEVTLGADFDSVPFGWDNEFPAHRRMVPAFEADATPVRNAEYLAFLEEGGYARPELWGPDAWAWKERVAHAHPVFWRRAADGWRYLTLFDELPLERVADWPVFVSWAEARAFARWRGGDLMTEAEYHRAAEGAPWGDRTRSNIGFGGWAPVPVGSFASGMSAWGLHDLVGNGWEWTSTRFGPFPGFRAWARTYAGYSADFFDEHHYVLLGGSWATDPALVRRSFRNWFQPHYPYVFAKFRCLRRG